MDQHIADLKKKIKNSAKAKTTVADLTAVLHDVLNVLDEAVETIKGQEKTINELSKDVKGTKTSIKEATKEKEARFYNLEKNNCAANLVVKNVDIKAQDGERETKEESKLVAEEILNTIGVKDSVKIRECIRFEKSKKYESNRPPILLIKLEEAKAKSIIYKNVQKLKGSRFQHISISNEYPAALRPKISWLTKIGNKIREDSEDKSTKFQIQVVKGGIPMLKTKTKDQDEYEFLEESKIPKKYL